MVFTWLLQHHHLCPMGCGVLLHERKEGKGLPHPSPFPSSINVVLIYKDLVVFLFLLSDLISRFTVPHSPAFR